MDGQNHQTEAAAKNRFRWVFIPLWRRPSEPIAPSALTSTSEGAFIRSQNPSWFGLFRSFAERKTTSALPLLPQALLLQPGESG